MNKKEVWKKLYFDDLDEKNPRYAISNRGKVKSLRTGRLVGFKLGRYMAINVNIRKSARSNGRGSLIRVFPIHRLVAEIFIKNPEEYKYVLHADRDRENNNASNLYWSDSHRIDL